MVTMGVDEGASRPEFGKCLFSHQADIFYQYCKKIINIFSTKRSIERDQRADFLLERSARL